MKKTVLLLISMLLLTSFTFPNCLDGGDGLDVIPLTAERIKSDHGGDQLPKSPIQPPSASQNDHTFYINGDHPDYVLQLVDANDETTVVYEISMPAGTNNTVLPSIYSGQYIIQLLWNDWRFWGFIEL